MELTHLNASGAACMVDVSGKPPQHRIAVATATIEMQQSTVDLLTAGLLKKGDALAVARVAGIMAAKKTPDLIPLCHGLNLDRVSIDFVISGGSVTITATAACTGKTGVEMEALTAASVAALTMYDMCKAVDKGMIISSVKLVEKRKEPPS